MTQPTPAYSQLFPRCADMKLVPVSTADGVEHIGFDGDAVKSALGAAKYADFMAKLVSGPPYSGHVFSCGHRKDVKGYEIPCIYANDLETYKRLNP